METNENVTQEVDTEEVKAPEVKTEVKKKEDIDITATFNKIRSEEKNKHQADIAKWKAEAEKSNKLLKEKEDAGKSDLEKLLSQNNELILKLTNSEKEKADYEKMIVAKELELYKTKKLREVGNDLIEELVVGNSPEEIDLSIAIAQKKYNEIVEKVKSSIVPEKKEKVGNPSNPNISKDKVRIDEVDVSAMSIEEYKKHQVELKRLATKIAKNQYG